jgi:glycosyltransferase involved in cell wall biosynthesis
MTADPFISIITAALNSAATIQNTLTSIEKQPRGCFEHIVIDGGSTDKTRSILRRHEGAYPLRWVSEPDRGIADALNKGIRMAAGRYLLVLQADDVLLDPSVLRRVHRLIQDERFDICSFQVIRERPGAAPFLYRAIRVPGWYHFKHTIPHQGAFVHRRLFEKIGGFREQFSIAMDYDFFYRAFQDRASIRYFHRPVSRMGGCGISSRRQVLLKRLDEEKQVQELNERSMWWRTAQKAFRSLYLPYKTRSLQWPRPAEVRAEPRFPS